ncbi:hypothetical protein RIF29_32414 [Crotalaria pallida]|uniref:Uncharacterized protein n=1 Tax=Crotalaria pallida TaxID=3830 RepID=A0AAN9ENE3_CROPI
MQKKHRKCFGSRISNLTIDIRKKRSMSFIKNYHYFLEKENETFCYISYICKLQRVTKVQRGIDCINLAM